MNFGEAKALPLTRKVYPKLAQWAGADADDESVPDMSTEMESSRDNRRRAMLSADSWSEASTASGERALMMLNGCPNVKLDMSFTQLSGIGPQAWRCMTRLEQRTLTTAG